MGSARRDGEGGFTLVEVLVAMIVLGIGVAALMGALGMHAKTSLDNRNQSQAAGLLTAGAEYVKGLPWGKFSPGCGAAGAQTIGANEIPYSAKFTVTYGPAQPPSDFGLATFGNDDTNCSTLAIVPVHVDSDEFDYHLSVNVMKRPADSS